MSDLNPEYTDEQVLIMNQELELEKLRTKVEYLRCRGYERFADVRGDVSEFATLKHEVNHERWRGRTRLVGLLDGLAKSLDEVPLFDVRKALENAQRNYATTFYPAIFVDTEFFEWHTEKLEQQMAEIQANYFIYHLTAADILAYGLPLPENAQ